MFDKIALLLTIGFFVLAIVLMSNAYNTGEYKDWSDACLALAGTVYFSRCMLRKDT